MRLRRFNDLGLEKFRLFLGTLKQDPKALPPLEVLTSGEYCDELVEPIDVEDNPETFTNRFAFAEWLHAAAERSGVSVPRSDPGFWAYLSLFLIDQTCPQLRRIKFGENKGKAGRYVGSFSRHIPELSNFQRSYRHLLAGPYSVYLVHIKEPERALVALINPLDAPGDLSENLGGSRLHALCPGTMALATYLFVDKEKMAVRTSAGSASKRLGKIMNQYTRTFDLPEIDHVAFAGILPKEFDRFKRAAES